MNGHIKAKIIKEQERIIRAEILVVLDNALSYLYGQICSE